MNKDDIIKKIEYRVTKYSIWTIGITDDPIRRKTEHENDGQVVTQWEAWEVDSEQDARDIEKYFLDKGMESGGDEGEENPTFVYNF